MGYSLRARFGLWLERFPVLNRWLFRYDGIAPGGNYRAVNRVSRHLVLMTEGWQLVRPGARRVPGAGGSDRG